MNNVQKIQLNLLLKLDEICKKHNLNYYLAYGSCIGAMRHKGFIPWDHDIDVLMPFDDAMKLIQFQNEFGDRYFVSNRITDNTFKYVNMRLLDKNYCCVAKKGEKIIKERYVCIDIYPFYNCPPTKIGLLMNIWRSHLHKLLVGGLSENHNKLSIFISKIILLFFKDSNRERDIQKIENKLNYKGKSYEIADYFGQDISLCHAITYKKQWFSKPKSMLFEGHCVYGPTDPDAYLRKRYGDYMSPPSKTAIENEITIELITEKRN